MKTLGASARATSASQSACSAASRSPVATSTTMSAARRLRPLRARVIQADNDGRTRRACVKRNAFVHAYQKSVV